MKWNQQARKKSSHTVPLEISYENWQSQTPRKKSSTGDSPVSVPNRKKYTSHLLEEPRSTPATQPRKKGHYLELSLFTNGLSFKTILPNLLLFSRKIRERNFLFFLVEFAPCLLLQLACPKWQFPCYSWVNPFLLEKSLPLKVNSFKQQE